MQSNLQITFRGMAQSARIESRIRVLAARLERFEDRITSCHVIVDVPHRHHVRGRFYSVHLEITTPTGPISVTRDPSTDQTHKDMNAVIRDAFDAATRQLDDAGRSSHRPVRAHAAP
jgi:ribosome-associated translation inhibitor RaiA